MSQPVSVALVGAGIFAKRTHLPTILKQDCFELIAIYSRSAESARKLLDGVSATPDVYHDGIEGSGGMDALFARDDLRAVIVCLPVGPQEDAVRRALAAGKHVLSEKPIAGSSASAVALTEWYARLSSRTAAPAPLWLVAENWRAEGATRHAARLVRDAGRVRTFSLQCSVDVQPDNAYVGTGWRVGDKQNLPGGFLMDGGVHWVALLRAVVGDIKKVAGSASLSAQHCAPVDTLSGVLWLDGHDGAAGTLGMCFAAPGRGFELALNVVCDGGTLQVRRSNGPFVVEWTIATASTDDKSGGSPSDKSHTRNFEIEGIEEEFREFARQVQWSGTEQTSDENKGIDLSPDQAVADVRVIEGLLLSSSRQGAPVIL
ncbi:hypothetical protein HKX48_003454 [Thoreauomyces humboldtii]|nr:hypothetical protein HKX48_003454 [Thoreauomyces humboldtii]